MVIDPAAYPFERFAAIRRIYPSVAFSKDGRHVVYSTDTSGQFNLWHHPVDGGAPQQLTVFEHSTVRAFARAPGDDSLAFLADQDGNEFHQVYLLRGGRGWPEPLTDAPNVQHHLGSAPFSPDGRYLAYGANDRTPADVDVLVRDLRTGEVRRLGLRGGFHVPANWSPDGRKLLVIGFHSNTDVDLILYDLAADRHELLTPRGGDIIYNAVGWSRDGRGCFLLSNEDREFVGLAYYDLADRSLRWLEMPEWDVEHAALSRDGRMLVWVVNEDGLSRLYARDLQSGRAVPVPEPPQGVISALTLSDDGRMLAFVLSRPTRPYDVYTADLATGDLRRMTDSALGALPDDLLVEPELIRYPSWDGRQIPAWLFRPRRASPERRAPVVLSIHGGPEAQERPGYAYSGLYQYWLSRGIGVLAPNIRGSTGYGRAYQVLIHRDWGGGELRDIEAAARYLRGLDWVDARRLGVFGGSFGGFATLSALSRLPEYWAAGVDLVGPANLITFARSVPPHWRRFMARWVGDPDEDAEMLRERSPITYADQIRAPLLVIQGAQDPRVVKAESDQMVERLRDLGRHVEYLVFEDEGHGFTRRANQLKALKAAARFMEERLAGRDSAAP
ncbi:MAG TPA: S9 family peptidase [Bacillota bacterium]